jgi:DNA-binding CsgD family transcriptional regulator
MTTTLCILATLLAILTLPLVLLLYITETRQQRIKRWRAVGWTQQRIADRLGCSRTTVRRILAA